MKLLLRFFLFRFSLLSLLALLALATCPARAADSAAPAAPADPLATLRAGHPRLVFTPQEWAAFDQRVKNRKQDPQFDALLSQLENNARKLLDRPPLGYKKIGYRLLAVSREAFRRITTLAVVYRATHDEAFARRAEKEMLNFAAFSDWNPPHFLDVAEMTAALAFGYDWLHDSLAPESRAAIRKAIVEKGFGEGLDPKLPRNNWQRLENNWNQVCWGGLTLGALAIAEDEPQLARDTLTRARAGIVNGLKPYAPDGVYPEGPGYWSYGTTYQVLVIAALESALGDDWGLPRSPGFMESAKVMFQLTAPSGYTFNFSDCAPRRLFEPALYWFAKKLNTPALATPPISDAETTRFLPLVALWWPDKGLPATKTAPPDMPLAWKGEGINPVAVFRSSWTDPNAMWLAVKAGAANANHGHMDAGSFVFEADGVRWAIDLGSQDYESLESKGLKIWGRQQTSDRWRVFRLNNFSHNTLTIGDQLHRVDGRAEFENFWLTSLDNPLFSTGVTVNLLPVFAGQATKVKRDFVFRSSPSNSFTIEDRIKGVAPGTEIRWAMATKAQVQFYDDKYVANSDGKDIHGKSALLTQDGKQLRVRVKVGSGDFINAPPIGLTVYKDVSPISVNDENQGFEAIPADPPKNDYDALNPDTRILIVRVKVPASGNVRIIVLLQAEEHEVKITSDDGHIRTIRQMQGMDKFNP